MCHAVLQDPEFFLLLLEIDQEIAGRAREAGCRRCGAALHSACYPRKPRGCPAEVREQYASRFSFCCAECNRRTTPASVRFLGRRVYVAVMLMLVSPAGGPSGRAVCEALSVPTLTLSRWRSWWQAKLPRSRFWQCVRERFSTPLEINLLPQSLLERFVAVTCAERLAQALTFVSPLSIPGMSR